ncbi:MAG: PAS domain S-box protein [Desulfobacterales bacterium]|nr:PAS domain S-box protein [Desulfobacterales bacterium]
MSDKLSNSPENLAQKIEELNKVLSAFFALAEAVNQSLNLQETLKISLERVKAVFNADAAHIRLMDEETNELVLTVHQGLTPEDLERIVWRRKFGEGTSWRCARSGKPLIQKPLKTSTILHEGGLQISATIPLKSKGKIIGTMALHQKTSRTFFREEIELFRHIGDQIGVAIENARLHNRLLESEKKYKALFETSREALLVLDLDGKFHLVNHPVEQITGYTREELIGNHFKMLVSPQDLDLISGIFDSGYENFSKMSAEIRIIDKTGQEHIIELLQGASLVKTAGITTGYFITARDLTEKRKTEEKLLQTAKLQSLGEMASGIAHDFNNILMVILGHTELLLYEAKDEILIKKLRIIERAALDGSETVRKIGDFTRTAPKETELVPVDLRQIIHNALEFTASRWKNVYQKEGYPFELKLNLNEIPTLPGDESELQEAFVNIILNSLDAMPHGGSLEIESRFLDNLPAYQNEHKIDPAGFLRVKITDTGIGMDEQTRKKIFDPFFSTKGVKGLGLGLSIAYGIIKRHHGDMKVDSRKGFGTTFTIYLPLKKTVSGTPKPLDDAPRQKRTARILVVDDEPDNLDFLSELLERLGHHAGRASDGEAALKKFKAEGPWDMVFTDLGMPGISGWDLVRELKTLDPTLPAVLITGWGFQLREDEIKAKKVDYVISKPFKIKDVTRVIDRILARQRKP